MCSRRRRYIGRSCTLPCADSVAAFDARCRRRERFTLAGLEVSPAALALAALAAVTGAVVGPVCVALVALAATAGAIGGPVAFASVALAAAADVLVSPATVAPIEASLAVASAAPVPTTSAVDTPPRPSPFWHCCRCS